MSIKLQVLTIAKCKHQFKRNMSVEELSSFATFDTNRPVLCQGQSRYPRTGPVGKNPSEPDPEPPENQSQSNSESYDQHVFLGPSFGVVRIFFITVGGF